MYSAQMSPLRHLVSDNSPVAENWDSTSGTGTGTRVRERRDLWSNFQRFRYLTGLPSIFRPKDIQRAARLEPPHLFLIEAVLEREALLRTVGVVKNRGDRLAGSDLGKAGQ